MLVMTVPMLCLRWRLFRAPTDGAFACQCVVFASRRRCCRNWRRNGGGSSLASIETSQASSSLAASALQLPKPCRDVAVAHDPAGRHLVKEFDTALGYTFEIRACLAK